MNTGDEHCVRARKIEAIEHAFAGGDLDALRAAVDDPSAVPNGVMPIEIGSCLVFAIYRSPLSFIRTLLELGADPTLRTRIDDCETPIEMAESAGLAELASVGVRKGQPIKQRLRSGLTLLEDVPGTGPPVRRQQPYRIRLRLWLNQGEPVRWPAPWGPC